MTGVCKGKSNTKRDEKREPRLPLVPVEEMPEKTRKMILASGPTNSLNINKMMAHAENSVRHYMRLGSSLLSQVKLDARLRELSILRVAILCDSYYEWYQHEKMAREAGVPEEKIAGVKIGPDEECFSGLERLVLEYTDEVTVKVKSTDETFRKLAERFDHRELVELTLIIGFYNMVARFLENTEVQVE
ncbi:carboxymuconolactone decarboxylase family protein [Pelotomaculum isophthalicicum JI]|uniref:Carboxymuconolactone decarboxylase family protein n=1 Tax=Pelotomaculum isophthalicicum JI TaxID=947010 RepID=A0A9X4JWX8_9FIRM|nr:carboxymuconolactone decarboxylase family protein [Pelotomaculum isophthalicicum]MDF9410089.1 carboxymuconolactone decarboxylase family protein [Pelotomaculum isophthalicicum JI]